MVLAVGKQIISRVTITFSNGQTYVIDDTHTDARLLSVKLTEELSAENNLPIGVNSANVLDLEIDTTDLELIPENTDSTYYGYMNNTAYIDLQLEGTDVPHDIFNMGRYYVNTWKSNITNDTPTKVVINAVNLMAIIASKEFPSVMFSDIQNIKQFLIDIATELNSELDVNHQIVIDPNNINFLDFPTMQFSNLNTETIENILNGISQCTLTNIYIDRANNLKTDYLCDDTSEEAQYFINILTGASNNIYDFNQYDGVKVNYSLGNIKDTEELASMSNVDVVHSKDIDNIKLGDAVYSVDRIITTAKDNGSGFLTQVMFLNKNKINLHLSGGPVTVDIKILGRRVDDTTLVEEIAGTNQLEITNRLLPNTYIPKYAQNLNDLISIRDNSISVEGYLTPDLQIGDMIYINCEGAMNVSGYYKINKLQWTFDTYPKCVLSGIKTFEKTINIDLITENLNDKLEETIAALFPSSSEFTSLNAQENQLVNNTYNTQLTILRGLLYGG